MSFAGFGVSSSLLILLLIYCFLYKILVSAVCAASTTTCYYYPVFQCVCLSLCSSVGYTKRARGLSLLCVCVCLNNMVYINMWLNIHLKVL